MHIVLISTPIGFLGSGKGGGVELTLNSLVTFVISWTQCRCCSTQRLKII